MSRVFVGGFPRDLEEEELKEIFEAFGQVQAVKIVRDKRTGISRRFGFVDMDSRENADTAIQNLHEGSIDEDIISVKHAVIEEPKPAKPAKEKPRAQKVQYGQRPFNKNKPTGGYKPNNNGGRSNNYGNSNYGNRPSGGGSYGNRPNNNNRQGGGYNNGNSNYGNNNYGNSNYGNSSYGNSGYGNSNYGNSGYSNSNRDSQGGGYNNNYNRNYNKPQQEDPNANNSSGGSRPKRPRINRNG